MNLHKRNRVIEAYKGARGTPAIARVTDEDLAAIQGARADHDARTVAGMEYEDTDEGRMIGFSGVSELIARYFPTQSLNIGPLLGNMERYSRMSAAETFAEMVWLARLAEQDDIRTIGVHDFFDGNDDVNSISPQPLVTSFAAWREALLAIADRSDVTDVRASVFDLPSPDHRADDSLWIPAHEWFVWSTAPLKEVRAWVKPLSCRAVRKVPHHQMWPLENRPLPPKTHVYRLVLAEWSGIPVRRCTGPVFRPNAVTYAPSPAERTTMKEEVWRLCRERLVPAYESPHRELLAGALDAYHELGRTGIPTPALWESLEQMMSSEVKALRTMAVEWLWAMADLSEARERLWLAYDRSRSDLRLLFVQHLRGSGPLQRKLLAAALLDRSAHVRLFAANRITRCRTPHLHAALKRVASVETNPRAKKTMEYVLRSLDEPATGETS